MIERKIEIEFNVLKYTLYSSEDKLIIESTLKNELSSDKWSLIIEPKTFNKLLNLENALWKQVKSTIEEMFEKKIKSYFSDDSSLSTLNIECLEPIINQLFGEKLVVLLYKNESKNVYQVVEDLISILQKNTSTFDENIIEDINLISKSFSLNEQRMESLREENFSLKRELEKKNQFFNQELSLLRQDNNTLQQRILFLETELKNEREKGEIKKEKNDSSQKFHFFRSKKKEKKEKKNKKSQGEKEGEKDFEKKINIDDYFVNEENIIQGLENSFVPLNEMSILKRMLLDKKILRKKRRFNPIYIASVQGFESSKFHQFCDGKKKVLVLIKVKFYYFGGYTNVCWGENNGSFVESNKTFIFSLSNPSNVPVQFVCVNPKSSIFDHSSLGPVFGVNDICIGDNSNENTSSYSNLGGSFEGFFY